MRVQWEGAKVGDELGQQQEEQGLVAGGAEEVTGGFGKVGENCEGGRGWADTEDRLFGNERKSHQETQGKNLPL